MYKMVERSRYLSLTNFIQELSDLEYHHLNKLLCDQKNLTSNLMDLEWIINGNRNVLKLGEYIENAFTKYQDSNDNLIKQIKESSDKLKFYDILLESKK